MNNVERIDNFLKYWAKIVEQNPNFSTNIEPFHKMIYSKLIRNDVSEKDLPVVLSSDIYNSQNESTFEHWIRYYKNNKKIDVFNSIDWSYFCQFISTDYKAKAAEEHIKIYIPLDNDHIKEGAKLIFNFLTQNNISHNSKIGRQIRFDDIVIRLINEEDAQKLLNFVNNNAYIQEGLVKANPFAFQQNGIAMACDGSASYNETVAYMIAMYLKDSKEKGSLNSVNYQNFYHYIANNYKKEFIEKSNQPFQQALKYEDDKKKKNYQHIIALILNCQNPEFNLQNYFNHYHHSVESKKEEKVEKENSNTLLLNIINAMVKKHGIETAIPTIKAYILTNNSAYITRDENLRNRAIRNNLSEEIRNILKKQNISFEDYIKEIYAPKKSLMKKSLTETEEKLLVKAIIESEKRFPSRGIQQIYSFIVTGQENYLTRNNNVRQEVVSSILREKILTIIKENKISIEQLLKEVVEKYHISINQNRNQKTS